MISHHDRTLARRADCTQFQPGALKVVVAATDFTPAAIAAARRAAQLAQAGGARLALLHVVTPASRMVTPLLDVLGVGDRSSPAAALSRLRQSAARPQR